jgi:hypothetical protein
MAYTDEALRQKMLEMYPELTKYGISVTLDFNKENNTYIVKFSKGAHELTSCLEKKDSDDCMNDVKCLYLGVQVGKFVKYFEKGII